jgi:cytochrome b subunit of formate dehydrogenase
MNALWRMALLTILVAGSGEAAGQPPSGAPARLDESSCAACHGEQALWGGDNLRLFVPLEQLADDVHRTSGVQCIDCHGGDSASFNVPQAHAAQIDAARTTARPFKPLAIQNARAPARLEAVIQVCGKCHQGAADAYLGSVHGHGFQESGLVVTAVCTDCHGSHGIYRAADSRSMLHPSAVGATCARCHRFIQERLEQSVHGDGGGAPAPTEVESPPADAPRKPNCIDCHQGHDLPHPRSSAFRLDLADRCGSCHALEATLYAHSLHGQLTELGYLPAAKCSDCHGAHDILPVAAPASRLSSSNRRATCAACHADVSDIFLDFDPHANPRDPERDALLFWVDRGLTGLLASVFVVFGAHSALWLVRSLPHVAAAGRPQRPAPGGRAYVRFRPVHRAAHLVLMISFMGLALTGLPLHFSNYTWAQTVSRALGGFASTGLWHRIFGIANICCLVFYIVWFGALTILGPRNGDGRFRFVFGPDSPVPNRRDLSDLAKMLRWFVGRGPRPTFERWTYWEKFDLWAAAADIVLIGTTGLILWFPNQACALLPGESLNVAALIHGKLALLATGFVFAIHFFSANLRPEKFPLDTSILTGLVSEDELATDRPELVERLRRTGQWDEQLVAAPSRRSLTLVTFVGLVALSIGLALLVAIVAAML